MIVDSNSMVNNIDLQRGCSHDCTEVVEVGMRYKAVKSYMLTRNLNLSVANTHIRVFGWQPTGRPLEEGGGGHVVLS